MELTFDQEAVVSIKEGRHLVLAPPGSGKTEMLSQRILRAIESGVDPARMLCATFTNRAAFEMRDRVEQEIKLNQSLSTASLPDVGNLHHFCHKFLSSVGKIYPGKHVLDEVQQCEFIKEIVDVLCRELKEGCSADMKKSHGVSVIGLLNSPNELRCQHLLERIEKLMADSVKNDRNPYADILSGVLIAHQRRIGITREFIRPMPPALFVLAREGVLWAIDVAYTGLKRRFKSVDFDDLVNETFLWLEHHELDDSRKFLWVQIDEVQDLSPMQWCIVKRLTAPNAVSVYFGDVEQAIFSFLGASIPSFMDATRDCTRHYFKKNFRATPLLLEILMRFSIASLKSDWEFLPEPFNAHLPNGELAIVGISRESEVISTIQRILGNGTASNVAILVRRNVAADHWESLIKPFGYRYAKVSGHDLFTFGPMRDFLAFVSLFTGSPSMVAWESLALRFGHTIRTRASARYFVRSMFASGFDPMTLFDEKSPIALIPKPRPKRSLWSWKRSVDLRSIRDNLLPAYQKIAARLDHRITFRELFEVYSAIAFRDESHYFKNELPFEKARARIEKFLRYTDHIYANDSRSLCDVLGEDWNKLTKLKEADLLVGDEKIVISTIHKAKGRQFDAVIIPDVADVLSKKGAIDIDDPLRLLYVAMSRAKRHLYLFNADEQSVLDPIRPCFASGYRGYYLSRSEHRDLTSDWLYQWEQIASGGKVCIDDTSSRYLSRIRLKAISHLPDIAQRRAQFLAALASKSEDADVAIDYLRLAADFSPEAFSAIRSASLTIHSSSVCSAAFRYFHAMLDANYGTTPDFNRALQAIGDSLYSSDSQLRFDASNLLLAQNCDRVAKCVIGSPDDFERLASVADPDHEFSIRLILSNTPPSTYEHHLRTILQSRALKT